MDDDGLFTAEIAADGIKVSASFTEEAKIPAGAVLSMKEIIPETQQYEEYFEKSGNTLNESLSVNSENYVELKHARFFDIGFTSDGEEIEPQAAVSVEFTYDRPDLDYESLAISSDVIHFEEDQAVLMEAESRQDIPADTLDDSTDDKNGAVSDMLRFETESFSAYGIIFYNVAGNNIGDLMDGQDRVIAWFDGNESTTGKADKIAVLMNSYFAGRNDRLGLSLKTFYDENYQTDNSFLYEGENADLYTQYFFSDDDVPMWHFSYQTGGYYYITTEVDGATKYLTITNSAVKLLDSPDQFSRIYIDNNGAVGTNRENKLRFRNSDNYAINRYNGNYNNGFGSYKGNQDPNEWFILGALSEDTEIKTNVLTAEKVSVSDTEKLHDGVNVIIYAKKYENGEYVNYAINGDGDLVKVWESGDVVQWRKTGPATSSLFWQFIQYGDTEYYEFYNPETGMYLAPQNGQILSNSPIGVTLTGRENGDYRSSIEAWDDNVWSWYAYKYSDRGTLIPVADTQALAMCFAVERSDDKFQPIETVDSKAEGITIKMYDYDANLQKNIMGNFSYTAGAGATSLVRNVLDPEGYPALKNGTSLEPLFTPNNTYPEREANHLFIKSTYDETGYFEYSCFENSAFLMKEDGTGAVESKEGYPGVYDFTVYQELATPANKTTAYYRRGNFLPFDKADSADAHALNQYDDKAAALPAEDPRKDEDIYIQSSPDFYYGMSIDATFMIPEKGCDANGNPLVFEFSGDDDFWLFIDDVLVLDIGGVHDSLSGSVNFSTGEVSTYDGSNKNTYTVTSLKECFRNAGVFPDGSPWDDSLVEKYFKDDGSFQSGEGVFKDYSSHTMKIFYMERGAGASNLKLRFNLATVDEKSVFLEKKLTGTQTTDYSNTKYAYQLYYKPEGSDDFILYENPDADDKKAHYEGQNSLVEYSESAEINGIVYDNVFFLRAGEKAEFTMPSKETEYYFAELSVFNQEYEYVNINSDRAYTSDYAVTRVKKYPDVRSATDTVSNRKRVVYENHIDQNYLKKLIITKNVVDKDGNHVENDNTGFEFQVGFLNEEGETVPYQKREYYVMDDDGNYYVYLNGRLSKSGREKVVCSVSGNNGSIAGIPDGFSVVIEGLLPRTAFHVEELEEKIPLGYEWRSYERVTGSEGATYNLLDSGVYNIGEIRENTNAHMIVTNQKGFGITVNKHWSDAEYTNSHASVYIALFHKEEGGELRFVENTLRELISPNTTIYYFNDEQEASEYAAMEVIPGSIQPADWNGDTAAVTDCQPYTANSVTRLSAETFSGEAYDFDYKVGYVQGEVGGTGHNIRTDTITNSRDFLKIIKQDPDGAPLIGAEFTITDVTSGITLEAPVISDENGLVTNAYLTAGHSYRLDEIKAPNGFKTLDGPVMIYVNGNEQLDIQYYAEDADNIIVALSEDRKSGTLTVRDEPKGILLRKTDEKGEPLKDAEFALYSFDRAQNRKSPLDEYQNVISDENGFFFSDTLPGGYYLAEETKAPKGYSLPDVETVFHIRPEDNTVDQVYTVRYNGSTKKYVTVEDVFSSRLYVSGNIIRIDFPNEKEYGQIKIRKTIDGMDPTKSAPAFMFRVTQTKDENGNTVRNGPQYTRAISYSRTDEEFTREVVLSGLPLGSYIVEELSVLNYTAADVNVEGDEHPVISSNFNVTVTLDSDDMVTVAFTNHLEEDPPVNNTAFADNRISYADSQSGGN